MLFAFARRVARGVHRQGLWGSGDRILVALSGGADSVALTRALVELSAHANWQLAGLVHVNHGLRGAESDEDEAFCRELARILSLPVEISHVDVRRRRRDRKVSLEVAARDLRYDAFRSAAARLNASIVATAHTADDQAETVLLRLLRGASSRGVTGIRAKRGMVVRPLLELRRVDVMNYLREVGQPYREDSSNRDRGIPRNQLRQTLMPLIERDWPGGVRALGRFAELAGADESYLSHVADMARGRLARTVAEGVQVDRAPLAALAPALSRRVVRQLVEDAGGRPSSQQVRAVLALVRSDKTNGRLDLAGADVGVAGSLVVVRAAARSAERVGPGFSYLLDVPGDVRIPETGGVIQASLKGRAPEVLGFSDGSIAVLQQDRVVPPLTVRSRRTGDRFRPLGAPGSRKVQDLLVDRKVPLGERDRVPIVEDAAGAIVWVAGLAMAESARVTRPEGSVVILSFNKDRA